MGAASVRENIWDGDRLNRRHEAETIEKYLVREAATFRRLHREESIVLGIDAPYGRGKTWFLERLGAQLELSHPVARINAWADDVGDEPLIAFMAAIDEALAPYLKASSKLRDRMAAAKAAALPVMGKLVSGALVKALTKIAGDEIEEEIGGVLEEAVRGAKTKPKEGEDGAASVAMEAALEKLGNEIDNLVDRRGAAMLTAYRQRKLSRDLFRQNMRSLVANIDGSKGPGAVPLIVIIDELDRCRPHYALRTLEEIKHFFEIPGVVFILGLHGGQLSKSIKAVYGSEFDSDDYLRRFFTRRYELRPQSIVELVAASFEEWGLNEAKFEFPEAVVGDGYMLTKPRLVGLILAQWHVTPREITAIMDGLRLFLDGWEHNDLIEPIGLLSLLVQLARGQPLNFLQSDSTNQLKFKGLAMTSPDGGRAEFFTPDKYLAALNPLAWAPLSNINNERDSSNPARNYLRDWLKREWRVRTARTPDMRPHQSHLADYIPRIMDLARFIEEPQPAE